MLEVDIDESKLQPKQQLKIKFNLKSTVVYESENGYHFTDYLDPINELSPDIDSSKLTSDVSYYIEHNLQSNAKKFEKQIGIVERWIDPRGALCLDVGIGGGLYLSLLKARGAKVFGIEPNDSRAYYAQSKYGLVVSKLPIENEYWQNRHKEDFDLITFWDVIEHVNFPAQTLEAAARLLKQGGYLMLDTPFKGNLYYRIGSLAYRMSNGRCAPFLNAIYRNEPYGHKQIFSIQEIRAMLEKCGLECKSLTKFHELSFPVEHYLRRLHIPKNIAKVFGTFLGWSVKFIRIRNKVLVVAQKV